MARIGDKFQRRDFHPGSARRLALGGKHLANQHKQKGIGELLSGPVKIVRSVTPPVPAGEWVKFSIEARATNLTLDVNGRRAFLFSALEPASGHIGLQAEGWPFDFRNLKIFEITRQQTQDQTETCYALRFVVVPAISGND